MIRPAFLAREVGTGLRRSLSMATSITIVTMVSLFFLGIGLLAGRQVEAANAAFSPSAEEVAWSRVVVAAFDSPENAAKGVLKVEGRMVERLHLAQARRVIAVAEAIAAA